MNNSTFLRPQFIFYLLVVLILSATLTACSTRVDEVVNNNQDKPTYPPVTFDRQLTGTVAVGAAVSGTVQIIGVAGDVVEAQSNAEGTYSINLGDRRGPYLIRIIPNDGNIPVMYSYATSTGVANVTPFTTLALYIAYKSDLEIVFNNWSTTYNSWDRSDIEKALAKLNAYFDAQLLNAAVDPKTYDFIADPFTADQTGIDAFLENYSVSVDFENSSYEIIDNSSSQPVAFDENIDTTGYYIGAPFIPDGAAVWEWTVSSTFNTNGEITSNTQTLGQFASDFIPLSKERFNETFWDLNFPTQTTTCDGNPSGSCDLTWEVTRIDTDYNVTGDGGIGTVITGEAHFAWRFYGWVTTVAHTQIYDESYSWDYTWTWERVE